VKEDEVIIKSLVQKTLTLVESDGEIVKEPLPEDDPKRRRPDIARA
jgi:UDP-glucuronate decarboxylase